MSDPIPVLIKNLRADAKHFLNHASQLNTANVIGCLKKFQNKRNFLEKQLEERKDVVRRLRGDLVIANKKNRDLKKEIDTYLDRLQQAHETIDTLNGKK